jgi:general secretion pathway protein I
LSHAPPRIPLLTLDLFRRHCGAGVSRSPESITPVPPDQPRSWLWIPGSAEPAIGPAKGRTWWALRNDQDKFQSRSPGLDAPTAGFTLIEVLVALAVVAISLVSIGSVMATSMRGVRSMEQHVTLMESARAIANNLPPRAQLAPGTLTGEIYGNRWRVDVTPFSGGGVPYVAESQWLPQTVRIRLQSPTGASLSLETVRLQPRSGR